MRVTPIWRNPYDDYRGTWGVPGTFSTASAIQDMAEVVRFLRKPANTAKYRIDPKQLVIIEHSFGGFIAAYAAAHDPDIKAVAMIAATNPGKIKRRSTGTRRSASRAIGVAG